jgi:hypothetical protein
MDARIAPLAGQMDNATNLFRGALIGVGREHFLRRPGPHSNPMVWVAGHLTQFRCRMAAMLGVPRELPWTTLFSTGSVIGDLSTYPEREEIERLWADVSGELAARVATLNAAELNAPPPPRVASTDGTMTGVIALFTFHEAYHVGQLGYLRRFLGYPSLMG